MQGDDRVMMRFEDVSFSYGGAEGDAALRSVTFSVGPGEFVVVLGANGSGKSTLARLCNGLLLPTSGRVEVDGIDTRDEGRRFDLRASVGLVFQRPDDQIVATAVEDDVAFGPENLGLARTEIRDRVDEALAAVGLSGLERREPHLLSGGQKQRLAISGALAMRPRYLVLDEPTSMIDAQGVLEVREALHRAWRSGHGVLLISHDLRDALRADRVIVLSHGSIVYAGEVGGLLGQPEGAQRWGLEVPAIVLMARRLRELGVPAPELPSTPDEVVNALWR